MPILSKERFELIEFVPIPVREKNSLFILKTNPILYYKNGRSILSLPESSKLSLCTTQYNLTICSTLMEENVVSPTKCIQNLLLSNLDDNCFYKQIQMKNYFIWISESKIFAYIVQPIDIVKQCDNTEDEVLLLTQSQEISLNNECTVYKLHHKDQYESTKHTITDIHTPKIELEIGNFTTHAPISKLPILEKYEIQQIQVINSLSEVREAVSLSRERIDKIKIENPIVGFFEGWNLKEWLIYGSLSILGTILVISIGFTIIKKLIKKLL